jgi:D-methionine transport system ATP-binding protein
VGDGLGTALELVSVFQHVGPRCALDDISLRVECGDWLLVIGPNGAGKSLLTRLILGLDSPSAGTVRIFGSDLNELAQDALRRLRGRVGAVLQGGSLLDDKTVLENLLLPLRGAMLRRQEEARAARLVMTQLQLDGLENHMPRSLSLGHRRRVELARALVHEPALLIWDGLTDGLDPASARETLDVLRRQQELRQLTLVATDNRPDALSGGIDRIGVLDRGRLLFDGSRTALTAAAAERLELRYALEGHP